MEKVCLELMKFDDMCMVCNQIEGKSPEEQEKLIVQFENAISAIIVESRRIEADNIANVVDYKDQEIK